MIDFHCHLDLYPDPEAVAARASAAGVYVLAVTTTPRAWAGTNARLAKFPRIRIALGLHPQVVHERHQEVARLCELIGETRYVGEIGLDASPEHAASLELQRSVLNRILSECAANGGRILSLHSRGAASAVLNALEAHPRAGLPVLHWFSGTRKELDRAIRLGCWFSVGPAMLRSEKGRKLAEAMPRERVLTETDGPFASEGKLPLMPWDVSIAEERLAELWQCTAREVEERLTRNLRALTVQQPLSVREGPDNG